VSVDEGAGDALDEASGASRSRGDCWTVTIGNPRIVTR
jgi:hypothetical protein